MRIILLGCPGAGKGTQAQYLAKHFGIPLIATGDMLRAAVDNGTELGLKIKQVMDKGALVPDDIIISLVKERLRSADCQKGYLLDGFPRTIAQAEALEKSGVIIDNVIEIHMPDDDIVERLSGRRIHLASGRIYHVKYNQPKVSGVDDNTGEALVQRDDDKEETIRKRLEIYHEKTEPLVKYYQARAANNSGPNAPHYIRVDGVGKIEQIQERIFSALASASN